MTRRRLILVFLILLALVSGASAATVTLEWVAPTLDALGAPLTDLAGYNIYRCTGSACTPSVILVSVGLVTTYQDTTISLGTIYRYLIKAIDGVPNESASSNIIEIGPPPAPTDVIVR